MALNRPKKVKSISELNKLLKSNYIIEPKLDGSRHILKKENGELKLLRENGRVKNSQFPEIIKAFEGVAQEIPDNTILDGEVCYLKSDLVADFYSLLPRENLTDQTKINYLSKNKPLTFVAFDIIEYDSMNLKDYSLSKRHEYLNQIKTNDRFKIIQNYSLDDFMTFNKTEMEGIVLKNLDSTYNNNWYKHKFYVESDFKVIGYTSETRLISALELSDQDNNYVGKVNYINYPQTKEFANTLKGKIAVVIHQWTNKNKVKFPVLKELR